MNDFFQRLLGTRAPGQKLAKEAGAAVAQSQDALSQSFDPVGAQNRLLSEMIKRAAAKRSVTKMPKSIVALAKYLSLNNVFYTQPPTLGSGIAAQGEAKQWARSVEQIIHNTDDLFEMVAETGGAILYEVLASLDDQTINQGKEGYRIPLYSMMGNFHKTSQRIIETMLLSDQRCYAVCKMSLFPELSGVIQQNLKRASGLSPHEEWGGSPPTLPLKMGDKTTLEIIELYFARTEVFRMMHGNARFEIEQHRRTSHTHILAGSGWGKTQLLQNMISDDLDRMLKQNLSVILLDSEGQIIENVLRHPYFAPGHPSKLKDKLRIIDPAKINGIPGFNVFNMAGQIDKMSMADRDKAINNAASIVAYSLNALSGNPLTAQQDILLYEVIRLLHYAPGANWELAIDCLRDESLALKIAQHAPERVRKFFENEFMTIYKDRRNEVSAKLNGLVRSETLTSMLQDRTDRFDVLKSINAGEIIIIKADKNHLGSEMATFFGRLMIAMIHQAILPRSQKSPSPCYFYIDEAWEYLGDERLTFFYAEARKRGLGLILAHHTFSQMSANLQETIKASTEIKIAGRGTRKDAKSMAGYMNDVDPEMILNLKKVDRSFSEFLMHVKGQTISSPVVVRVPHGTLEKNKQRLPRPVEKPWPQQRRLVNNSTAPSSSKPIQPTSHSR